MTGLDASKDRVCELCVVRCQGREVVEQLESLVDPEVELGKSSEIHGLHAALFEGAPKFAALVPALDRLLNGAIVVGHGVAYDVAFLEAELARLGRALHIAGFIDTLVLSRRSFSQPSHKLTALVKALGLSQPRAHRAGDDARATMELFWKEVEVLAATSPADLREVRVGERHARPEIVARALEAVERKELVLVRYRPARRPPEDLAMVLTGVRSDVDPPRVLGYGHPGRGRKELRADRILAILPFQPARPERLASLAGALP